MEHRITTGRLMIETAALARIEELAAADGERDWRSEMTEHQAAEVPAGTEPGDDPMAT
jgi:hypothetical protein